MPPKGSETRSNGQPAPREFSASAAHRRPEPPKDSWWIVPPDQFSEAWRKEQDRFTHTSTNYQPKAEAE